MKSATRSWRTTIGGIIAGLVLVLPEVADLIGYEGIGDGVFSWEIVLAGLGLMGLGVAARDSMVSSEEAGAK